MTDRNDQDHPAAAPQPETPSFDAIEPLLSAYLLEELDAADTARVEACLESSTECREALDALRATADLLRQAPALEGTLDANRRQVLVEAAATPSTPQPGRGALGWAAAVAAVLAFAAVLPFLGPREEHSGVELASLRPSLASPTADDSVTASLGRARNAQLEGVESGAAASRANTTATTPAFAEGEIMRSGHDPAHARDLIRGGEAAKADRSLRSLAAADPNTETRFADALGESRALKEALVQEVRLSEREEARTLALAPVDALRGESVNEVSFGLSSKARGLADGAQPSVPGVSNGLANRGAYRKTAVIELAKNLSQQEQPQRESRIRYKRNDKVEALSRLYAVTDTKKAQSLSGTSSSIEGFERFQFQDAQGTTDGFVDLPRTASASSAPGSQPKKRAEDGEAKAAASTAASQEPALELSDSRKSVSRGAETPRGEPSPAAGGATAKRPTEERSRRRIVSGSTTEDDGSEAAVAAAAPQQAGLDKPAAESPDASEEDTADEVGDDLASESVVPSPSAKELVDEVLSQLDRQPGETPDAMFFRYWQSSPFVEASSDPLSTFGADVDTASYTLFRSYLFKNVQLPPRDAIRTEEFINYFANKYAPPAPDSGRAFAVHNELAPSPFAHEPAYKLLKVGLKGRVVEVEKRKACSLVFVIDTSGSMRRENRLELVKEGLRLLVPELDEGDTIGIVTFDKEARTILDPIAASETERILDAIGQLEPRRNTNVDAGLALGYQMAADHLLEGGVNRVLLLSDGVANTGNTQAAAMLERVKNHRERGVYLTCVGVGMGNHNDALLEELADRGDGQCVYVDRGSEARRVFVDNLTGTLETIARDVKIQVEFDPERVLRYRLLGYENRAIADRDFRNNKVDAGEVGAGHEVTAVYELKLKPETTGEVATVRVRYLTVDHGEAQEFETSIAAESARGAFADASPRFQLTACVAEAAEILRESYWARGSQLADVGGRLDAILESLKDDEDVIELRALLQRADPLMRQRQQGMDELSQAVDALKVNFFERARVEGRDAEHLDALRADTARLRERLVRLVSQR